MDSEVLDLDTHKELLVLAKLNEEGLNRELQKGYDDMLAGRTRDAKQVFADIRRDYGL